MNPRSLHACQCLHCGAEWDSGDWTHHPSPATCHKCGSHDVRVLCPNIVSRANRAVEMICPRYAENIAGMNVFKEDVHGRFYRIHVQKNIAYRAVGAKQSVSLDFSMFNEQGL